MDRFFIDLLLLDEGSLIGIALLTIIAGGLIGANLFEVRASFRRVVYLWWYAGLHLLVISSQFGWLMIPAAAEAGLLSVLCVLLLGAFLVFGAGLYYGSAARSNDIRGDTSRAWLGFVPLANLWLLFAARNSSLSEEAPRPAFARWVLDPVSVILALVVFTLSQGLNGVLEEIPASDIPSNAAFNEMIAEAQSLEERFAAEARASGAELPIRVDDITTFTDIRAEGEVLRMRYDVDQDIQNLRPDFEQMLAETYCGPDMFAIDIARGGTIAIEYFGPGGNLIQGYEITSADCRS